VFDELDILFNFNNIPDVKKTFRVFISKEF